MLNKLIYGLIPAVVFATALSCYAGVEGSGGAESALLGPAWFLAKTVQTKIRTCTLVSPDFGVEPAVAQATLSQAFRQWGDYMVAKKVQRLPNNDIGTHLIFVTDLDFMATCDGSEDLRVYFGVKDEQVLKAKARYSKPFGFVQATGDADQDWGKGFIYIATPAEVAPAPDWTTGNHLLGVLLHEIGHVLGNNHLDGTIMAADIGKYLSYGNSNLPQLDHIDGERELRMCIDCAATYNGIVEYPSRYSAAKAFETLFGSNAVRLASVQFLKIDTENFRDADGNKDMPKGSLVFTDQAGAHTAELRTVDDLSFNPIDVPLFARRDGWTGSYGETLTGFLTTDSGKQMPVIVNINTGGMAFEILRVEASGQIERLFMSSQVN